MWLVTMFLVEFGGVVKGSVTLNNGVAMPTMGFGTAGGIKPQEVAWAFEAGYRMFDTAQAMEWYNEDAVREGLASVGASRDDVWITSKLHARDHGYESVLRAFPSSLHNLNITHIDAFLLHHPSCWPELCDGSWESRGGTWQDSWKGLEELYEAREVRAIGVSNFNLRQLKELVEEVAKVKPMIVQNHFDPGHQDNKVRMYCKQHNIAYMGYSTLGTQYMRGNNGVNLILTHPVINQIAAQHHRTPAQVVLSWAMSKDVVVIPRTRIKSRIQSNLLAKSVSLTPSDINRIDLIRKERFDKDEPDPNIREVKIWNPTHYDVEVRWNDDRVTEKILAGDVGVQTTFVGHRFVFRSMRGEYISEYTVTNQESMQRFTLPNKIVRREL